MKLIRYYYGPDCTLGQLFVNDGLTLYTIERAWMNNQLYKSCVPDGEYTLSAHNSDRHGQTVALVNPDLNVRHWPSERQSDNDRSVILFHSANFAHQLEGCIAVGITSGYMYSSGRAETLNGVKRSREAMSLLRRYLSNGAKLHIMPHGGATLE